MIKIEIRIIRQVNTSATDEVVDVEASHPGDKLLDTLDTAYTKSRAIAKAMGDAR